MTNETVLEPNQVMLQKNAVSHTASESIMIEVYLFSLSLAGAYKHLGAAEFFKQKLSYLNKYLLAQPIFLNLSSAQQYAKFIGDDYLIIKAKVPESFIEGQSHALVLKTHLLNSSHVQGIYLGWEKPAIFIENLVTIELDNSLL